MVKESVKQSYLIYFKPSEYLEARLNNFRKGLARSGGMEYKGKDLLHATLFKAKFSEKYENNILEELMDTERKMFAPRIIEMDLFAYNSLVVRLEKHENLQQLHEGIIRSIKPYTEEDLPGWFGKDYAPHITLCKSMHGTVPEIPKELEHYSWLVSELFIAKKVDDVWHPFMDFSLGYDLEEELL